MTDESRVAALKRMVEARPDDVRARFGLALEYERLGRWVDAVEQLRFYLAAAQDEGNAYGRLGRALRELGRNDEARAAYQEGIQTANRNGHPSMAEEFEETLEEF